MSWFWDLVQLFVGAALGVAGKLFTDRYKQRSQAQRGRGPGPIGRAVLPGLKLSPAAQLEVESCALISAGETGNALMEFIRGARRLDAITAICGGKGDYADSYYDENFKRCDRVERVFSYDAIVGEIAAKRSRHGLNGLKRHLARAGVLEEGSAKRAGPPCAVFFVPQGTRIKDVGGGGFDPPLSFGLAMRVDEKDQPISAIAHWEVEAEPLRHVIAIEGLIVDAKKRALLERLQGFYFSIVRSNKVLNSKEHVDAIRDAYESLERRWGSRELA